MNNTFIKGLIMAVIILLATTITTTGWPSTGIQWAYLSITTIGTVLVYLAKNAIAPSTSDKGHLNLWDLASGAIMAVGNFLMSLTADTATGAPLHIWDIAKSAGTVFILYLAKNFLSAQSVNSIPPNKTIV